MKHESTVMGLNIKFGFYIIVFFGIRKCCAIEKPTEMKPMDDGKTCAMTLNACKVVDPGLFKARDGLPGHYGEKGDIGAQGLISGFSGSKGEQGLQGDKGDKGDIGEEGPVGIKGFDGRTGYPGNSGFIGKKGHIGPSGVPGKNGVCYQQCTRIESGEVLPDIGTKESPSDALCNSLRNFEKPFAGKIWVNPHDKFEVECKDGWTCLLTESKDVKYNGEDAFNLPENQNTGFWLTNKFAFDLSKFYGVNMKRMALLQKRSKQVTQTIRYHCKNSYVMENPETALRLLSANDVVIGPHASDFNPTAYAILPNDTHGCTEGASKSDWLYSDITVRGNARKLPVIDFFINDTRMEDQSFFLESVELCFG